MNNCKEVFHLGRRHRMNKKRSIALALLGIAVLLISVGLSGCTGNPFDDSSKFVGKWHILDTTDYFTFNADGTGIIDMDMHGFMGGDRTTYSCTWKVSGDTITISSSFGTEDYRYEFVDDPYKYEGAEVLLYLSGKCVMGLRKIS